MSIYNKNGDFAVGIVKHQVYIDQENIAILDKRILLDLIERKMGRTMKYFISNLLDFAEESIVSQEDFNSENAIEATEEAYRYLLSDIFDEVENLEKLLSGSRLKRQDLNKSASEIKKLINNGA